METSSGRPAVVQNRRTSSLGHRTREPDRFGILLCLIVVTLFGTVVGGSSVVGTAVSATLAAAVLLFALSASAAPARIRRTTTIVAPLLVVVAVIPGIASSDAADITIPAVLALLVLGSVAAVGRRLQSHPVVTGATILGAVCLYLLLGLLFASIYAIAGGAGRVFVQQATSRPVDDVYFSFITLATVGYGDLTPSGDLIRIVAAVEALVGQLYLVTVIAVLVGNVGAERRRDRTT
jgi:Ion channel